MCHYQYNTKNNIKNQRKVMEFFSHKTYSERNEIEKENWRRIHMAFSKDFLWGAASAAHQIEGAYKEDGKGEGVWNHFEHEPGRIKHSENADIACDHYHRFKEDVALMKKIGLKSYRLSISWPRVMPHGVGEVNEKGLQFYSDLIDELLAAGIEPLVTLHHWNLPMDLYNQGGWKNDESPKWFEEFTKVVVERLSDRVKYWMTFNEFQIFVGLGYLAGIMAPFEQNDIPTMIKISENLFRAHGKAVSIIRKYGKQPSQIGLAPTGDVWLPLNDSPKEIERVRQKSFSLPEFTFVLSNVWWADPIFLGQFCDEAKERFGELLPDFTKEEWAEISQPLDFYGFNAYQGTVTFSAEQTGYEEYAYQGSPKTSMNWNITPEVMYWSPKFLYERYKKPILVTENGMAGMDWVALDGKVHDPQRIDFLNRYLLQLEKAVDEGIPVIGYQQWSIMDNYEWCHGYDMRFGLIHVDYKTQKRTLKDSAYWYSHVIETNGASLHNYEKEA